MLFNDSNTTCDLGGTEDPVNCRTIKDTGAEDEETVYFDCFAVNLAVFNDGFDAVLIGEDFGSKTTFLILDFVGPAGLGRCSRVKAGEQISTMKQRAQ